MKDRRAPRDKGSKLTLGWRPQRLRKYTDLGMEPLETKEVY